jgi:hypothetical protein
VASGEQEPRPGMPEETQGQSMQMELVAPAEPGTTMALYSNFIQVTLAPHDFTFHLGWFTFPAFTEPPQPGPTGTVPVHVRPLAKVSVPLTLVQGIIRVLQSQVEAWEAAFGQPFPEEPKAGATRDVARASE